MTAKVPPGTEALKEELPEMSEEDEFGDDDEEEEEDGGTSQAEHDDDDLYDYIYGSEEADGVGLVEKRGSL